MVELSDFAVSNLHFFKHGFLVSVWFEFRLICLNSFFKIFELPKLLPSLLHRLMFNFVKSLRIIEVPVAEDVHHLLSPKRRCESWQWSLSHCVSVLIKVPVVKLLKCWLLMEIRELLVQEVEEQKFALILIVIAVCEQWLSFFFKSLAEWLNHKWSHHL